MLNPNKKEKISIEVIRTLVMRFEKFPGDSKDNRNAPFHKAFLKAFSDELEGYVSNVPYFISLSSWLHGLNTTLGQSFFENVAHILSDGEKRKFKKGTITIKQQSSISNIITDLKNEEHEPNIERENILIFNVEGSKETKGFNFSADNYIEEDNLIEAIELKSVRPNAGEMRGEKQKILNGKAVLKKLYPNKKVDFFIGFPFDPLSEKPTDYNKERFIDSIIELEKYFSPDEILLAGELWDRLSGQKNTMQEILDIINNIATPDFIDKFKFIRDHRNYYHNPNKYKKILIEWNLNRELELINNIDKITNVCTKNKKKQRKLNQLIFDSYNRYKVDRYDELIKIYSNE